MSGSVIRTSVFVLSLGVLLGPGLLPGQVASQNVNMVSGTQWPGGDPFLQRQNEPSIAVSSRNARHLLAGANDYRAVDIPFSTPNAPETGDAWLGVFKSFDGGITWRSTLLPGYPQQNPRSGPLATFSTAADPVVRAGTNGLFYYAGIAFNRDTKNGVFFVSRFMDLNNKENGDPTLDQDPIRFIDTKIVDSGNGTPFIDKPWIAVDKPRLLDGVCRLTVPQPKPGNPNATVQQTVPAGAVYAAWTEATGSGSSLTTNLYFSSSSDCAASWSTPVRINDTNKVNQGASIAIDPATGVIYVVWRRFASGSQTDAILVSRSLRGRVFTKPSVVVSLPPYSAVTPTAPSFFDQGTTSDSFRTNAYPTVAIDRRPNSGADDDDQPDDPQHRGRVYVAWSQRGVAPTGDARIVLSVSTDGGQSWSAPSSIDNTSLSDDSGHSFSRGHQFMPQMTSTADRITVIYYDARLDHSFGLFSPRSSPLVPDPINGKLYLETRELRGELLDAGGTARVFTPFLLETGMSEWRHTLDLRVAQANAAPAPAFTSARLSQYIFGTRGDESGTISVLQQLQVNPPNLKLFQQGSVPFLGDYIDVAGPMFLPPAAPGRRWRFNSKPDLSTVFVASWTSNQDVRPPLDGNWANYTPVASTGGSSIFNPGIQKPPCASGQDGMRNQNIYAARISQGLAVSSVQNAKPLSSTLQRALSLNVENLTPLKRTFRMTIAGQPAGGRASFVPAPNPLPNPVPAATTTLDVVVPANSSVARSVYALSTDPHAMVEVDVAEVNGPPGGSLKAGGLTGFTIFNTDPSAPNLIDPDGNTAPSVTTIEVYNPNVSNPNVSNPNVSNPNVSNPNVSNPNVSNPNVSNPNVSNPNVSNADLANPNVSNPNVSNPNVSNPNVSNPNVSNPNVSNEPVSDATYTVTNDGNTASTYRVQLAGSAPGTPLQVILSKPYGSPASENCVLFEQQHNVSLSNVVNPTFVNANSPPDPGITDPSEGNATFVLGPKESILVTIRGPVDVATLTNIVQTVAPVVVAHAPNTNDPTNRPATSPPVITTSALPDGVVGQPYSAAVAARGGRPPYSSWTATGLPAGLSIGGATGLISGMAGAAGTSSVGLSVTDSAPKTGSRTLSLRIANPLIVTTATLPGATPGSGYSQTLASTGGLGTRTWTVVGGALPSGIGLSASGVLSGIPASTGTFAFTVQVVDSASPPQFATRALSISILSASVGVSAAPSGLVGGQAFALTVHVEDNTAAPIPGALITLSFGTTGCPAALLSGTTVATTNVAGNAIFPNLSIDRGGPGFSISASASAPGYGVVLGTTSQFFVEGFCATGPTAPPRTYASLTKLADGRVLLAGGQTLGGVVLDTARVYDPSTGAFTPTSGNMLVPRFGHQAVLLPSGKVLILGGSTPSGPTNAAELFDPATLSFAPAGASMSVPRINFRATWVPAAGRVLVTGGQNVGGFLNSAEVYDPSTASFSATETAMTTARELHTATPIPDGRVLVAGGAGGASGTAELWNPVTGAFSAIAPLAVGRDSHAALALSSGRILLVGGESGLGGSQLTSAEVFDPATGQFTLTSPMSAPRSLPLVAPLPSGKVLVAGGYGSDSVELTTAEVFDPLTADFSATGSLVATQGQGGAVLLSSGNVLVAGSDQFNPNGELFYSRTGACDASALAAAFAAASGSTQTINLTGGCTYSFVSGSVGDSSTALPHVTAGTNLTINGNGATIERLGVAGVPAFRLFAVDGGATLTLNGVTIRNGGCGLAPVCPDLEGGGALVSGTLNVVGTTFSANDAGGDLTESRGGAIESFGALSVDQSTFSGNSAQNNGGAIFNWGGALTVTNSTFASNHARNAGGAIVTFSPGASTITNSTFAGNTADLVLWSFLYDFTYSGSAIYNQSFAAWIDGGDPSGLLTVTSSTFSGNGANGAVTTEAIPFLLSNSILSGSAGANCALLTSANDGGYNISSDASCGFLPTTGSMNSTDPLLDPNGLSSAGGPTQVVVPLPGSPAVDAIPGETNGCGTSLTTDQRGATRPTGAGCDIGAVEFPPVIWGWATLTNVKLNGGTNVLTLPGGGAFTISHDYTVANDPLYCPGCIDQIEIGLAVSPPVCVYNGIPYPPQSGTVSTSLTAPSAPGVYYIGMDWALNWGCFEPVTPGVPVPPYWNSGPPGPNRYIGKVIVP